MTTLQELSNMLAKAEGPSRELEVDLARLALRGGRLVIGDPLACPMNYTASIDAALALVAARDH